MSQFTDLLYLFYKNNALLNQHLLLLYNRKLNKDLYKV